MIPYSRIIEFSATGGVLTGIALEGPARGTLERLIITQVSGVAVAAAFSLYDRRGAIANLNDINVTASGTVTSVVTASGKAQVTFGAAHAMVPGALFDIKGSDVADYNVRHTVVTVVSPTVVVTDINYTSNGTGGYWQTAPLTRSYNPASHLVHEGNVTSGVSSKEYALRKVYHNSDVRHQHQQAPNTALWLAITPAGTGSKLWQAAYTLVSNAPI